MIKRILVIMVIFLLAAGYVGSVSAEEDMSLIKGTVQQVAPDKSYVVLNEEKFLIDAEIAEYMNMEVGDDVEVTVSQKEQGKVIMDFNYI